MPTESKIWGQKGGPLSLPSKMTISSTGTNLYSFITPGDLQGLEAGHHSGLMYLLCEERIQDNLSTG